MTSLTAMSKVQHLLPEMAQLMVQLIGLPNTLQLIQQFGGTTFAVAKNQCRSGQLRYEVLADTVGADAAATLTQHFGGEVLAIPRCTAALRELRNRAIRAGFDHLTQQHHACYAVTQLARQYQLTERHIWSLLKHTDQEPSRAETPKGCSANQAKTHTLRTA